MSTLLDQLQQLAPLAAQATPGPWRVTADDDAVTSESQGTHTVMCSGFHEPENMHFIARARNVLTPENLALLVAGQQALAAAEKTQWVPVAGAEPVCRICEGTGCEGCRFSGSGNALLNNFGRALAAPVAVAADAGLLSVDVQQYDIQCRAFGTAEWLTVAFAYDEQEGLELLDKVVSSWARHEHRMVSLVLHTRQHPLARAPFITVAALAPQWVPVADRLPKSMVWVLVVTQDINGDSIVREMYMTRISDAPAFVSKGEIDYDVTHWMPLPLPPTTPAAPLALFR